MKQLYIIASVVALLFCSCGGSSRDKKTSDDHTCFYDITPVYAEGDTLTALLHEFLKSQTRIDSSQTSVCVYDLTAQKTIFEHRDTALVTPASCLKILTALTAIKRLGINHKYDNRLLYRGTMRGDTLVGQVSFEMSDDPLFTSFDTFTDILKNKGIKNIRGDVYLNLARRDTLRPHHTAALWDIPYHKVPLLFKGEKYITRNFNYALASSGIHVQRDSTAKPTSKYIIIAHSQHWLTEVITPMLIHSSNIKAEAVLGHINPSKPGSGSGLIAMDDFMRHEIDFNPSDHGFVINDGSGLSPQNLFTARALVALLRYAYHDKSCFNYLVGSALATPANPERSGSLRYRLANSPCVGRLFCKTGTLVTVGASGLTGYIKSSNGHWLAFSILNTDCPVAEARRMQDKFCRLLMMEQKK